MNRTTNHQNVLKLFTFSFCRKASLSGLLLTFVFSAASAALPELKIPDGFGVNIHFTGEPKDLDLIADAGFKFIRMDLAWSGIEREKCVYNFERTGYDALTNGCIKRGIRILYILDYSNRLYESEQSVRTPEGRIAFANFAQAAAKRYAGKSILWEIWNEPNIKQFWTPQPGVDDYCKLVEAAAPVIKQADPTGLVVAPATSTIPFDWLESCFKNGLLKSIDALTVHPYRPKNPETVIKDYEKLRELIARYAPKGKTISILSGEWGYSNVNWDNTRLTNLQQAEYLARMFLINLYQNVPVSIWYDWKNDGPDPNEREHNFGTVERDLNPKAAYQAAKTIATTLSGFSIKERLNVGSENDFVFKLSNGENQAFAFWTTGDEHEISLPVSVIAPKARLLTGDNKHEISFPLAAVKAKHVDMIGYTSKLTLTDNYKVKISKNPQYLLLEP